MKSFGPRPRTTPVAREPFEVTFMRDDEPEVHTFQARAVTDTAGIAHTLKVAEKHPERALPGMLRMISKMLDNKDGTPATWVATPLPREHQEDDAEDDRPIVFRGPDGELYPMSEAEKFLEFVAGSSRRRWLYLMEEDDEVTVDGDTLTKLFEWLVGLAAGRPTRP